MLTAIGEFSLLLALAVAAYAAVAAWVGWRAERGEWIRSGTNISSGYGFWSLVVFNAAFFVLFLLGFLTPLRRREWRSFGVYSAFIVALFTGMYGFPLTVYILASILGSRYPVLNPFSHASGHLWVTLLGGGPAMMTVVHIVSNALMFGGLLIIARAWRRIHRAQGALGAGGLYARVRHPQYSGLFLITIGLLIQWPTIITVLTWPILLFVYLRLAKREEAEMERLFGEAYRAYARRVSRFIPSLRSPRTSGASRARTEMSGIGGTVGDV